MSRTLKAYCFLTLGMVDLFMIGVGLPWMVSARDTFLVTAAPFIGLTLIMINIAVLTKLTSKSKEKTQ